MLQKQKSASKMKPSKSSNDLPKPELRVFEQHMLTVEDKWIYEVTPQRHGRAESFQFSDHTPGQRGGVFASTSSLFDECFQASNYPQMYASGDSTLASAIAERAKLLYVSHKLTGTAGDWYEVVIDLNGHLTSPPPLSALKRNSKLEEWQFFTPQIGHGATATTPSPPLRNAFRNNSCLLSSPPKNLSNYYKLSSTFTPGSTGHRAMAAAQTPSLSSTFLLDSDLLKTPPRQLQARTMRLDDYNFFLGFGDVFVQDTVVNFDSSISQSILTLAVKVPEQKLASPRLDSTVSVSLVVVPKSNDNQASLAESTIAAIWKFAEFKFVTPPSLKLVDNLLSVISPKRVFTSSQQLLETPKHAQRAVLDFSSFSPPPFCPSSTSQNSYDADYERETTRSKRAGQPYRPLGLLTPPGFSNRIAKSKRSGIFPGEKSVSRQALDRLHAFCQAAVCSAEQVDGVSAFKQFKTPESLSSRASTAFVYSEDEEKLTACTALAVLATCNWTTAELESGRRIIGFVARKQQRDLIIRPSIQSAPILASVIDSCVSCIFNTETQRHVVTTVDVLRIMCFFLNRTLSMGEKNRIRRNLQVFRPEIIAKNSAFFSKVMAYTNPVAKSIEKEFKVVDFELLYLILEKLIPRYSNFENIKLSFS